MEEVTPSAEPTPYATEATSFQVSYNGAYVEPADVKVSRGGAWVIPDTTWVSSGGAWVPLVTGIRLRQTSPTQLELAGAEPGKTYAIFHSNPIIGIPQYPYSPSGIQGTVTTDAAGRATVTLANFPIYQAFQPLDGVTLPGGKYSVQEVPPPALRLIETHNRLQRENPLPVGIVDFLGKVANGEDVSDFKAEHFADDLKVMLAKRQASGEVGLFSEMLQRNPDDASPEFADFLRKYQQAKEDGNSSSENTSDIFREFFQNLTPENLPPEFTEVIQTLTERSGLAHLVDEEMPPDFVRAVLDNLDVSQFGIITDIISAIIYMYAMIIAYIIVWIYYVIFVAIAEIIAAIIAWMDGIELPEFPGLPPGTIDSIADILTAIVLLFILSLLVLSIGRVSDGIATCMVDGEMIPYLRGGLLYKYYKVDASTNLIIGVGTSNAISYFYSYHSDTHYAPAGVTVYRGNLLANPPLVPGWSYQGSPGLRLESGNATTNGVRIKCFTSPMSSDPVIGQPWNIETEFYDTNTDKANWDSKLIANVDNAPAGLFDGTLGLTTGPREANPPTGDVAWFTLDPTVTHALNTSASRWARAYPRYRIVYTKP